MAEKPTIHVDDDWKRQAQEEKRRLAELEQQQKKVAPTGPVGVVAGAGSAAGAGRSAAGQRGAAPSRDREMPEASFGTLVQSLVTQVLFYLGDLAVRGREVGVNLDMAKHNLDTLTILEEKTRGNLTPEEQAMLDGALYETRMRFFNVASQYAQLP